jgi:hypothetical protein
MRFLMLTNIEESVKRIVANPHQGKEKITVWDLTILRTRIIGLCELSGKI